MHLSSMLPTPEGASYDVAGVFNRSHSFLRITSYFNTTRSSYTLFFADPRISGGGDVSRLSGK
jgi:hypothetical protein